MEQVQAPYGTWESPITAEMTSQTTKSARNCDFFVQGETLYWTEPRPAEKGRTVILRRTADGTITTLTPEGFDVRTKVHEYGGLSFTVIDDCLYFINSYDQILYKQPLGKSPIPLTKTGVRFADLRPAVGGIIAVGEVHKEEQVDNFLAYIDKDSGRWTILDQGQDFYASPAWNEKDQKLAWITWNHPNMPWDGCLLWTASLDEGKLVDKQMVAGGIEESIYQPLWSPEGNLFFISDREGWWNLYRLIGHEIENIYPMEAEFGLPLWRLGTSTWCFTGRGEEIICSYQEKGIGKLALLDSKKKILEPLLLGFTDYSQVTAGKGFIIFLAGTAEASRQIYKMDLDSYHVQILGNKSKMDVEKEYFSIPETIEFPSADGRTAYGYYYSPQNKKYRGIEGTLPPLIIVSHGGPTGAADPIFNLRIQYWTTRGFAVLDVDYGGSVGYGRSYRERLKGQWGIVDVEDCIYGATYLAHQKKVDEDKIVIRGGSAGGYTTLEALAKSDIFAAGASYYGVADLELLARDTHKFEARYLDSLVGPYPERKDLYIERSPIHHAEEISCPVIFFQGAKDKIVPLNQAETMYETIKKLGIKTELIIYENEEHGFRQAETLRDSMEKELKFYLEAFLTKTR